MNNCIKHFFAPSKNIVTTSIKVRFIGEKKNVDIKQKKKTCLHNIHKVLMCQKKEKSTVFCIFSARERTFFIALFRLMFSRLHSACIKSAPFICEPAPHPPTHPHTDPQTHPPTHRPTHTDDCYSKPTSEVHAIFIVSRQMSAGQPMFGFLSDWSLKKCLIHKTCR